MPQPAASQEAARVQDYHDVPVKFLGKSSLPREELPQPKFSLEAKRIFDTTGSHKTMRGNVPKELLLNLSSTTGVLTAIPKNGGLTVSLPISTILGAEHYGDKFAVIIENDPTTANRSIYAFQFRRKEMVNGFIQALRAAFQRQASSQSQPGSTAQIPRASLPDGGKGSQDDRIRELERLLAEEKAKAALAEVTHLQTVVKCVEAERQCAEMNAKMANMRADMTAAAVEMAAEMQAIKSSASEDQNAQVIIEINALRSTVEGVAARLVKRASKDQLVAPREPTAAGSEPLPTNEQELQQYVDTLKRTNAEMQSKVARFADLQRLLMERDAEIAALKAQLSSKEDEQRMYDQEKKLLADTITGLLENSAPGVHEIPEIHRHSAASGSGEEPSIQEIYEEIELFKGANGFGFSIAGGADDPVDDGDSSLYITSVIEGGAAYTDGRLTVGDKLVEVNGQRMEGATHDEAVKALQKSKGSIKLLVSRLPLDAIHSLAEEVETIELIKGDQGLGFSIAGGVDYPVEEGDSSVYITAVIPGGVAAKDGRMKVGDKLVKVNGKSLEGVTHETSVAVLQNTSKSVQLTLSRIPIARTEDTKAIRSASNSMQQNAAQPPVGELAQFEDSVEEVIVIDYEKSAQGLGFSIAGGLDHPVQPGDTSVYVTQIIEGGAAELDGRLRIGDRIIEVNDVNVLSTKHDDVVKALQSNLTGVFMKVSRLPTPKEETFTFDIQKINGSLGFSIAGGSDDPGENEDTSVYVTDITSGGAAERDNRIRVGDKLVDVNGTSVLNIPHAETIRLLQSQPANAKITVSREIISYHHPEEVIFPITFDKQPDGNIGFSVAGGTDDEIEDGDPSVFVTKIFEGSPAETDGRLQFGDRIVEANGIGLKDVTHAEAQTALDRADNVELKVARIMNPHGTNELIEDIEIIKGPKGFGFSIAGGTDAPLADDDTAIYITQIVAGGAAEANGRLQLGDKVLVVNDCNLSNVSHDAAVRILQLATTSVRLTVCRLLPEEDEDLENLEDSHA